MTCIMILKDAPNIESPVKECVLILSGGGQMKQVLWFDRFENMSLTGSARGMRCVRVQKAALIAFSLSFLTGYAQRAELNFIQGSNLVEIAVQSETNSFYGLEQSSDLSSWQKVETFSGDGSRKKVSRPVNSTAGFFRFVREENGTLYAPTNYSFSAAGIFSTQQELTAQSLREGGIEDYDALLNRFRSVYRLNDEVERLQALGIQVEAGDIIHLLREGELRSNLQLAVDAGSVELQVVNDLVKTRFSLSDLHDLLRLMSPDVQAAPLQAMSLAGGAIADSDSGTLDRRSQESRMVLNNSLVEVGGQALTRAQFGELQAFVRTLTPEDLEVIRSTNQDSTDGRGSLGLLPAELELSAVSMIPESFSYIPAAVKLLNDARVKTEPIPLKIIGTQIEAAGSVYMWVPVEENPPFTMDIDGTDDRSFLVNKTGLAWFRVDGKTAGTSLTIKDSNGEFLCNKTVPDQTSKVLLLPIGQEQVCEEFYIQKSGSADFQLIAVNPVESLDSHVSENGLNAVGVEVPAQRGGVAGGAGWFSFHVILSGNGSVSQTLHLQLNDESAAPVSRKIVAVSPSGAIVDQALVPNEAMTMELSLVSGLWQLMVLPADSFALQNGETFPSSVDLCDVQSMSEDAAVSLDLKMSFASVKTRQFVIGALGDVSFCRDGESSGNRAEVKLSLTANIAPRFDDAKSFTSIFGETDEFAAWDLWVQNGKSTSGLSIDPLYQQGLAAIKQNANVCVLLAMLEFPTDQQWLQAYTLYIRNELGRDWYVHLDSAEELYNNWLEQIVQISAMKFPMANRYNLMDSQGSLPMHPVVSVNMPQFAFPKDRMALEAMPICCAYSAVEMDELDKWDLFGSFAKGVVNAGLAIASGNFADAACSGVAMVDEMNSTIEAAKDDPIGAANYRMNRASSLHGFYGLDDASKNPVVYSGYAKDNQNYAMANALSWAKLACSAVSLMGSISSGGPGALLDNVSVATGLLALQQGDLTVTDIDNLQDLFLQLADGDAELIGAVNQFFYNVRKGVLEDDFAEKLDFSVLSDALNSENSDVWNEFSDLLTAVQGMRGVGQLGFNEIHSNAKFPFAPYDIRKTQGRSTVSVVRSVPLRQLAVSLDRVQVFDLQEDFSPLNLYSELFLNTRVGVVSDQSPSSWSDVELQYVDDGAVVADNGAKGFATVGGTPFSAYTRRVFGNRKIMAANAGDDMFPFTAADLTNPMMMNCQWTDASSNNAAAVFVEVGVYEDDGGTCDDDMVGVFSRTFLLEDLMQEGQSSWTRISDDVWRLSVTNVPVFSSKWLQTEVEIGTSSTASQRQHNVDRLGHPSALISLHIDMTLGEFTDWVDENDYEVRELATSEALPTDLNPRVVASSDVGNIDQILTYSSSGVLTRQILRENDTQNRLDVWTVSTNPASITHQASLPGAGADLTPFENSNYLNAALANDGRYVVVLSTNGLSVYDVQAPDCLLSDEWPMAALYPSRLAVDALGDLIYVSLREYSSDLRVFTINDQGKLVLQGSYDDINRTIVGLNPLPEGGLILHYAAHTETDCQDYDEGFWDDYDEALAWQGTYPHANGFWHMRRNGNALELEDAIDLAGDLSNTLMMRQVGRRNQSSAFRLYDDRTIISREYSSEVAIRLDASGNFIRMEDVNSLYDGEWSTRLAGVNMGGHQFSARIPGRNRDYTRLYHDCDLFLSPACVFNDVDYVPLNTDVPFTMNSDIYPLGDPQNRWALTSVSEAIYKPLSTRQDLNRASTYLHTNPGQDLALIDLYATNTPAILNPLINSSGFYLGHTPESLVWIDNEKLLGIYNRTYVADPHAFVMDASDPANPVLSTTIQAGLGTDALAATAPDGSCFVASENDSTNLIYRFIGDAASPIEEQVIEVGNLIWGIPDLLLLSDGRLLCSDGTSTLKCYAPDSTNGGWHLSGTYDLGVDGVVYDLVLSDDGTKLAVFDGVDFLGDGEFYVSILDATALASNQVVKLGEWSLSAPDTVTTDLHGVFSKDGNMLHLSCSYRYYGSPQNTILHLDVSDPTDISIMQSWVRNTQAGDLCVTPDGRALMVAGDQALTFYDTSDLSVQSVVQRIDLAGAEKLALNPDGLHVAVGCGTKKKVAIIELYNEGLSGPYQATAISPTDWSTDIYALQTPMLTWRFGSGQYIADQYHRADWCSVYLSTNRAEVDELAPNAKVLSDFTLLSTNYIAPTALDFAQTYYWRIVAHNSFGSSTSTVYRFTTADEPLPPFEPYSMSPWDGETGVKIDGDDTLQWGFGYNSEHPIDGSDLYLSSNSNLVNSLDSSVRVAFSSTPEGVFSPVENFATDQTYYWRVVGHNISGSSTGEVWSFSTESILSLPVAQGFENGVPDGWNVLMNGGYNEGGLEGDSLESDYGGWNMVWDTDMIHSGSGAIGINGAMPALHWLESPLFAAQSGTELSGWIYYGPDEWDNQPAPLHLLVKSGGVWNTVRSWTTADTAGYQQITVPLSSFAGQTIRIAWVYDLSDSGSAVALDDLLIENNP